MLKKKSENIFKNVKDHSVSGELFHLVENKTYGFLETTPKPSSEILPNYYKSEDYISHTDSKRNFFEHAYHIVRKIALHQKLKLITKVSLEQNTLLDIGCGTGDFLQTAQKNNWIVSGVEPNPEARAISNKKTNNAIFDTAHLSLFREQSFDVITLWHVLEHVPNLEEYIQILNKLLKPNGVLVIAVPNYNSYDARYYGAFWAAFDVPRHLWHFNKASISKLVSKASMTVAKIKPMYFDAFYVSLLSEKHKNGKMNVVTGFFIGLLSNIKSLYTKEASSLIYVVKNHQNSF